MKEDKKRTDLLNRSMHKWFTLISEQAQEAGIDMKKMLEVPFDVPVTPLGVKEVIFKPILFAMYGKWHTSKATNKELCEVIKNVDLYLKEKRQLDVPFPSEEKTEEYLKSFVH